MPSLVPFPGHGRHHLLIAITHSPIPTEKKTCWKVCVSYHFSFVYLRCFAGPGRPSIRRHPSPRPQHPDTLSLASPPYRRHSLHVFSPEAASFPRASAEPYPRRPRSPPNDLLQHSNGRPIRHPRKSRTHASQDTLFVHEPSNRTSSHHRPTYSAPRYIPSSPDTPKRTMLERALAPVPSIRI